MKVDMHVICLAFGVATMVYRAESQVCECRGYDCITYWNFAARNTGCYDNNGWPRMVCGAGLGMRFWHRTTYRL